MCIYLLWLRGGVSLKITAQAAFNEATPCYSRRVELWIMDHLSHETHLVFLNKIPFDCIRSLTETKSPNNKVLI